jgi:glycosyltransferase involved in cell wall biosynthesis
MNTPFVSYLVTCKNEGHQFKQLVELLLKYNDNNEIVVIDDFSTDLTTIDYLNSYKTTNGVSIYQHKLDSNYSAHKNYGKSLCKGKYIFQIDSDELPSEILLTNLYEIVMANESIELFWIPRINDFKGVTPQIATQWGWRLTAYENRQIVNWPDPQGRLFKNLSHLRWERRLHEKIEGAKSFAYLPHDFDLGLYHDKTIEKQIETNLRYNKQFTQEENQGFKLK